MRTVPLVGRASPAITRSSVDFPAPLSPKTPQIRPAANSACTRLSAAKGPKNLLRSVSATAGTACASAAGRGAIRLRHAGARRVGHARRRAALFVIFRGAFGLELLRVEHAVAFELA